MAESSVQSAVQWLGLLLEEESHNLNGIQGDVENLRDELYWMQCFLREADKTRFTDLRIRRWLSQIQEFAYEAEDIVESYLCRIITSQGNQHRIGRVGSIKNTLLRCACVVREAKTVLEIGREIETLRAKIETLTSRLEAYGIEITRSEYGSLGSKLLGLSSIKESRITRLDDQVQEIVGIFLSETGENRAIWGRSGVGKSTLARKVYHNQEIRRHFERFAFVNVTRNCKIRGVLRQLLRSLSTGRGNEVEQMGDQELVKELYEVQEEKKCLVILDDVWSTEIWDRLKAVFPGDDEQDSKSKVLVTTRNREVAEHVFGRKESAHEIECISFDESWELLKTKVGGSSSHLFGHDGANNMMEMAKKMLKFCQGIPLAILALGGLLATRKSPEQWQTMLDHMYSNHNGKIHQQPYEKVLEICYYCLPYYLKNCFLHLGSFPEDFQIPVQRLCHMWIAEGIVTLPYGEVTSEELSEHYLSELLHRGMVQVAKRGYDGRIKSCRLHNVMRESCLNVCKDESFLSVIDSNSGQTVGKVRRLALHLGEEEDDDEVSLCQKKGGVLRSLLLFSSQTDRPEVSYASVKSLCRDSQHIRVLDLEGIVVSSNILPREIGDLTYLRYLSLKDMLLTKLPPSIGNLRWVEMLDLRVKQRVEIPNVLWRMEKLKYLYLPRNFTVKDSEKLRLNNLKNVVILKNVNHFLVEDVLKMKNLKKSSVMCMPEDEHLEFIKNSPKIVFRLTIFRASISEGQVNVLQTFDNLIKLELKGGISGSISNLKFPPNLKKLLLDFCGIQHDPMPIFEKLPSLTTLCLDHQAYMGKKMVCSTSGFRKLTYLRLNGLKNLEEWSVEQGSMSNLLCLDVKGCERLAKIPDGFPQQVQITCI